jgi:hypothetical protein
MVALMALLLIFGTTLKMTHIHLDGAVHQDCALCQTAHSAVRPAVAPLMRHSPVVVRRVAVPPVRHVWSQTFSAWHWNRPPPTGGVRS